MVSKLPKFVKMQLKSRGWSQRELARKSGLSNGVISMVLAGSIQPSEYFCRAISKAFGVPYNEVMALAGLGDKTELSESPMFDDGISEIVEAALELPENKRADAIKLLKELKERPIIIYGGKP